MDHAQQTTYYQQYQQYQHYYYAQAMAYYQQYGVWPQQYEQYQQQCYTQYTQMPHSHTLSESTLISTNASSVAWNDIPFTTVSATEVMDPALVAVEPAIEPVTDAASNGEPSPVVQQFNNENGAGSSTVTDELQVPATSASASPPLPLPLTPSPALEPSIVVDDSDTRDRLPVLHNAHYNLSEILITNIRESDYYRYTVAHIETIDELVPEMEASVRHLQPFNLGKARAPSPAITVLYHAMTLTLTLSQFQSLIGKQTRSPYVRCLAFLYLRCIGQPSKWWKYIEGAVDDKQPVRVMANSDAPASSVGEYVRQLFSSMDYHGTLLKRIPIPIERQIQNELAIHDACLARCHRNEQYRQLIQPGVRVKVQYCTDNKFYDATVVSVLDNGKLTVEYSEYSEIEEVAIDRIDMDPIIERYESEHRHSRDRDRARSPDRLHRRGSRTRSRSPRRRSSSERDREERRRSPERSRGYHDASHDRNRRDRRDARSGSGRDERDRVRREEPARIRAAATTPSPAPSPSPSDAAPAVDPVLAAARRAALAARYGSQSAAQHQAAPSGANDFVRFG